MKLVTCPDCRNEISKNALACPYCGRPISNKATTIEKTSKKLKFGNIGSLTLVSICIYILLFSGASKNIMLWASIGFFTGMTWYLINTFMIWWHHK